MLRACNARAGGARIGLALLALPAGCGSAVIRNPVLPSDPKQSRHRRQEAAIEGRHR